MIGKNSYLPLPVRLIIISLFQRCSCPRTGKGCRDHSGLGFEHGTESFGLQGVQRDSKPELFGVCGRRKLDELRHVGTRASRTYYFAAKAYNATGAESDYPSEVVYSAPAACSFSLSPASQAYASSGGAGSVSVSAGSSCSWTAVSGASWLTVTRVERCRTGDSLVCRRRQYGKLIEDGNTHHRGQAFTVTQSGYVGSLTLSASAGSGGSISPSGTSTVASGGSKT